MTPLEIIRTGIKGLLLHKLRSGLSILGIVFGVASVISMLSVGEGARREALAQIELMGTNNITIRALNLTEAGKIEAAKNLSYGLTIHDAELIKKNNPLVKRLAPLKKVNRDLYFLNKDISYRILGTYPDYLHTGNLTLKEGRFLVVKDIEERKRVCVLGADMAKDLFPSRRGIGRRIRINTEWFKVVGVLRNRDIPKKVDIVRLHNINRDIYIPLTTAFFAQPVKDGRESIDEISVQIIDSNRVKDARGLIQYLLTKAHNNVDDYEIVVPQELLRQRQRTQRIFNIVMGCIAGISLLVGGIGIMNIMLANVSERTREIGIRRALGADHSEIIKQFLVEALLLTLCGGLIGIGLGIGMAKIIGHAEGWRTAISAWSLLLAFCVSKVVGIIFGLYPAYKASRMDPVTAIRYG
ncbi:MAG: ABC transporter permease [Nitrospinota bacterium]